MQQVPSGEPRPASHHGVRPRDGDEIATTVPLELTKPGQRRRVPETHPQVLAYLDAATQAPDAAGHLTTLVAHRHEVEHLQLPRASHPAGGEHERPLQVLPARHRPPSAGATSQRPCSSLPSSAPNIDAES